MADVNPIPARTEGPTGPKLALRNLTVARRSAGGDTITAASDVSFDVAPGEFVCLLGPSGCGKTSILNVLAGLERPSGGQALLDGRPIDRARARPRRPVPRAGLVPMAVGARQHRTRARARARAGRRAPGAGEPVAGQRAPRAMGGCAAARTVRRHATARGARSGPRRRPRHPAWRRAVRRARRAGTRDPAERGPAGMGRIRMGARRSSSSRTTCGRPWCLPTGSS